MDRLFAVILPAAGQGDRYAQAGGKRAKLEEQLAGRTVLLRAVELFSSRADVKQIIIAVDPDQLDTFNFKWGDKLNFLGVKIVPGGKTERWETVLNALAAVDDDITHVAVHDAARPVTAAQCIDDVFTTSEKHPAVIPGIPINHTIKRAAKLEDDDEVDPLDALLGSAGKRVIDTHQVTETVPRDDLWLVQTPQVFELVLLRRAYAQITDGQISGDNITDDAGLVEALGQPVIIVPGDPLNVKITVPDDLPFAAAVLATRGKSAGKLAEDPLGPKRKFGTWKELEDAEQ